jgi:ABC-type lipoprotein release transport system permease subunit
MWDQLRALAGILPKRRQRLDDVARELEQHLDLEAEEYRASGLSAEEAGQRMMSGLLFDVSPIDPLTFSVATLLLLGIASVATLVPGVRATRIDPARALYQG